MQFYAVILYIKQSNRATEQFKNYKEINDKNDNKTNMKRKQKTEAYYKED